MPQAEPEAIIRKKKRKGAREALQWAENAVNRHGKQCCRACVHIGCGFLLSFAELAGIPSGFGAAWLAACAAQGKSLLLPMIGCLAAFFMRMLWGLSPAWNLLAMLALMLPAQRLLFGAGTMHMMVWTGAALLPGLVNAMAGGTQRAVIVEAASVAVSILAAPVMGRAQKLIKEQKTISSPEEYLATGYTAVLILCGGARMMIAGMNIGAAGAAMTTLSAALTLGAGAGCALGLISGAALALQGLPVNLSVCLALGGFFAGLTQMYGRRRITCLCFGMIALLMMYLCGAAGNGAAAAAATVALLLLCMPDAAITQLREFAMRFCRKERHQDAYAAIQLERWKKTVADIVRLMPLPEQPAEKHDAAWWRGQLCAGCPESDACTCMSAQTAAQRADEVLAALQNGADESALDGLRGLGCARLYHLRAAMGRCVQDMHEKEKARRRAQYEHEIQTTHMTALAGAAARLAAGASDDWWDKKKEKGLSLAAAELALPVTLVCVRRINGHAQTIWRIDGEGDMRTVGDALRNMTTSVLGTPCSAPRQEENLLYIAEEPLFRVDAGSATRGKIDDGGQNGDIVRMGMLQDGCFLITLSDGMGHGAEARKESSRTAALLHLCLEAGYTREQALTVVNGMMLAAAQGERFATVDLAMIDLWSGKMTLDKLGAANSYLVHEEELICLTGDALPLGILEQAESRTCEKRMRDGDVLIMLSDGAEDAFASQEELHEAIRKAVTNMASQGAAKALLDAASKAAGEESQDDRTVTVLRLIRQGKVNPVQTEQMMRYAKKNGRVYNV